MKLQVKNEATVRKKKLILGWDWFKNVPWSLLWGRRLHIIIQENPTRLYRTFL